MPGGESCRGSWLLLRPLLRRQRWCRPAARGTRDRDRRRGDAPTTAAATTTRAGTPAGSATVAKTLSFTATTVDGRRFDAATLAGKPVVWWFWAAWCPRCQAAAGDVAEVARDYTGRVHVSVDEVRVWKPAPQPYRYAAHLLGVDPARLALVAAHPWDCAGDAAGTDLSQVPTGLLAAS
jgi:thiol-disulfide isomerase/thioredoxin